MNEAVIGEDDMFSHNRGIYLLVVALLFMLFKNISYANDFLKFMNSIQLESFKENKELSDLLKKNEFAMGLKEKDAIKKYNLNDQSYGVITNAFGQDKEFKIKIFSDIEISDNINVKNLGKVWEKGQRPKGIQGFFAATLRADKNYLFILMKNVAVDEYDTDLEKFSNEFIAIYGAPDFIFSFDKDQYVLLYLILYNNKPSQFQARFEKHKGRPKEEGASLSFELMDLSFAEFNMAGIKLKKAF